MTEVLSFLSKKNAHNSLDIYSNLIFKFTLMGNSIVTDVQFTQQNWAVDKLHKGYILVLCICKVKAWPIDYTSLASSALASLDSDPLRSVLVISQRELSPCNFPVPNISKRISTKVCFYLVKIQKLKIFLTLQVCQTPGLIVSTGSYLHQPLDLCFFCILHASAAAACSWFPVFTGFSFLVPNGIYSISE